MQAGLIFDHSIGGIILDLSLQHENHRIYAIDQGGRVIAEITFPAVSDKTVDIDHTFVDPSLRGQGVADSLMRAAVADIRVKGMKTRTSCPYAQNWFLKHEEFSDMLDK